MAYKLLSQSGGRAMNRAKCVICRRRIKHGDEIISMHTGIENMDGTVSIDTDIPFKKAHKECVEKGLLN